jgi:Cu-Zn family superoxide dismutase
LNIIILSTGEMQAAAIAAMAAHAILTAIPPILHLPLSLLPPNHSSFHGVSLNPPRQSFSLSLAAKKQPPLFVVASATKKAVAVLKGTSNVEGVVILTQEADGLSLLPLSLFFLMFCFECCCWLRLTS